MPAVTDVSCLTFVACETVRTVSLTAGVGVLLQESHKCRHAIAITNIGSLCRRPGCC